MSRVEELFPGARRALFTRYHIGGCASCGFHPDETLASVCARNDGLPVDEVIEHILRSDEHDRRMQIQPAELAEELRVPGAVRLIDVRSREEFEAVRIPGAELMTQDLLRELFATGDRSARIVVYCHLGRQSPDSAAYLAGHGFTGVRCLAGGIDAWSREVDPSLPRYRLEVDPPPA